jgi:hypothetical protein
MIESIPEPDHFPAPTYSSRGTSSPVTTLHGHRICVLVWHVLFIYVRQSLPTTSSTKSTSTYFCQTFHFCPVQFPASTLHPGHPPLSIHPVHQSTPPEPILFIHFLDNLARRVRSSDFSLASNQHTPYRSPRPVLVPSRPGTKWTYSPPIFILARRVRRTLFRRFDSSASTKHFWTVHVSMYI